jgi:hypothetical protein
MNNTDKETELKLIDAARQVAADSELLGTLKKSLSKVSRDAAKSARSDVREAIERLQTFAQLLTRRVMS